MNARRRRQASGQTLALFAILAPAMLLFMALGLDAAQLFLERRDAQGAADLAALSGVKHLDEAGGITEAERVAARSKAIAIGVANGYETSSVVPVTPFAGDDTKLEVTIRSDVDTFFLPILAFFFPADHETVDVSARAVAESARETGGGSSYAIFTLQPCGSSEAYKSIDWSGSTTDITGSVHSSAGILIGGSTNTVAGAITYECPGLFQESGSNAQIPPRNNPEACPGSQVNTPCLADATVPTLPTYTAFRTSLPCTYSQSGDFDVAGNSGAWFDGNNKDTRRLRAGKYCATGTLKISASDISVIPFEGRTGITLVADKIEISGSNFALLPPYDQGILAFANSNQADAIKFSGSTGSFEGLLYAPRGTVETSGSTNSTLRGAIVAYNVKLNGSDLDIVGTFAGATLGAQRIALIE